MGIFQKLIFLLFFALSLNLCFAQDLPKDYKVENDAQFEQAFRFLEKKYSLKYDSSYVAYKNIHQSCFDWIQKNQITNKAKKVWTLAVISNKQKNNILLETSQEYYVLLPEVQGSEKLPKIFYELGSLNIMLENYSKAFFYLNKYIRLEKVYSSDSFIYKYWHLNKELGFVYYQLGNYEEALKLNIQYYLGIRNNSYYFEPSALNEIGQCYRELKMKDSALKYFNLSIDRMKYYHNRPETDKEYLPYFKPIVESGMFNYSIEEKKYSKAINLGFGEVRGGKVKSDYGAISRGYFKVIVAYFYLNDYINFNKYFDLFEASLMYKANTKLYRSAIQFRLKMNISAGNIAKSKIDLNKMESLDSIIKLNALEEKKGLVLQTNLVLKDEEIKSINEQLSFVEKLNTNKNFIILFVSIASILLAFFYYKLRIANIKIGNQHQVIHQEYDKQNILIREVHHRVKNNLQLISSFLQIQVGKTKDVKGREVLDESINNINAIALIHENLYKKDNLVHVQLSDYIQTLAISIKKTFQNNLGLEIDVVCDPILISIDKTISIGLIINELITNSVKHGFENNIGHIRIDIQEQVDMIHFSYQDNGKGILTNVLGNENSLGLKLVKMLIDDIGGIYELILGKGFHLKIKFPL